jgi:hypothetical protein
LTNVMPFSSTSSVHKPSNSPPAPIKEQNITPESENENKILVNRPTERLSLTRPQ